MSIAIVPFGADDPTTIEVAYRIGAAANRADVPDFPPLCQQQFTGTVRHPMVGNAAHWALAHLDGVPAGYLGLELPQLENTGNAYADLVVHPAYRRRGVGRALHRHALTVLRAQGRERVTGNTVAALPDGSARDGAGGAFAEAVGAQPALAEVRRRLDVTRLDQAVLDGLWTDAGHRAAGYRLVRWTGTAPDGYAADVAGLASRIVSEVPLGDLDVEPEQFDVARLRSGEQVHEARGRRRYHCGAVHTETGRLVAWTILEFAATVPWHAFQEITIVDPAHRGHRLGLLVKLDNLRHTLPHEPELRAVDTWNAAVNTHMIAINETLGFRPVDGWTEWQLTL